MMASVSNSTVLKVISWNVNGLKAKLNSKQRNEELLKIIEEYDIVLLQETHIGEKDKNKEAKSNAAKEEQKEEEGESDIEKIKREYEGRYHVVELDSPNELNNTVKNEKTMYVTCFSSRRRGVAILINKPHICLSASCNDGNYAWVHAEIDCEKYTLLSVYYHSRETADLMDSMSTLLKKESGFQNKLVIGGDFNTSLNSDLDVKKENSAHEAQRARLVKFMNDNELSDVWREMHTNRQYTFSTQKPMSRLDYILMLTKDLSYVESCEINEDICLSDHFPVTLTLKKHAVDEDVTSRLSKLEL